MTRFYLLRTLLTLLSMTGLCDRLSTATADDWPQWQGPDRNAVSKETGLLQEWPKDGPPLAWKATGIGQGMGGIAVNHGRIYTTGDDAEETAWFYVINESDGKPVWRAKIGSGGNPGNIFKPFGPRATADGGRRSALHSRPEWGPDLLHDRRGQGGFARQLRQGPRRHHAGLGLLRIAPGGWRQDHLHPWCAQTAR